MQLVKFQELAKGTPVYVNVESVTYIMHGAAYEPSPIAGQPPRQIPGVVLQLLSGAIGVRGTIAEVLEKLNAPDWGHITK